MDVGRSHSGTVDPGGSQPDTTGSGDDVSLAFPTGTIDGAEWNAGPEETTTADEGADRPPDRAAAVW
jgi:hypothetical protein